jgi:hypothetical protein
MIRFGLTASRPQADHPARQRCDLCVEALASQRALQGGMNLIPSPR